MSAGAAESGLFLGAVSKMLGVWLRAVPNVEIAFL